MNQWDTIRKLARTKRQEVDELTQGETATELISAAEHLTEMKCVGL